MREYYSRRGLTILLTALVAVAVVTSGMVVMAQTTPGDETTTPGNETMAAGDETATPGGETTSSTGEPAATIDRQNTTYLRVLHASPGAPNVDVYLNNESALTDVPFGALSDYQELSAGTYSVEITEAGNRENVVFQGDVTLDPRTANTLAASGQLMEGPDGEASFRPVLYRDDAVVPDQESAALSVIHLSPDAPAVDIVTEGGTVLAQNISFREASDYVTVPAGNYTVEVRTAASAGAAEDNMTEAETPTETAGANATNETATETAAAGETETAGDNAAQTSGGEVVATVDVSLEGGTAYSAVAIGLVSPAEGENQTETGFNVLLSEDAMINIQIPSEAADGGVEAGATETATETEEAGMESGTATET